MIEDAGGSNDDATDGSSFVCLQAYVDDLEDSADDALLPL